MTHILYFHGFGSAFDSNSPKVNTLRKLGGVVGHNIDYTLGPEKVLEQARQMALRYDPSLLVGTSMGGWLAMELSRQTGIPYAAFNPCLDPQVSLLKYEGDGTDYQGKSYHLTRETVESYYTPVNTNGTVFVETGDEVIPYEHTLELLEPGTQYQVFTGGDHRFQHVADTLHTLDQMITDSRYRV